MQLAEIAFSQHQQGEETCMTRQLRHGVHALAYGVAPATGIHFRLQLIESGFASTNARKEGVDRSHFLDYHLRETLVTNRRLPLACEYIKQLNLSLPASRVELADQKT